MTHIYHVCEMDLDCLGITGEAKECACMICAQCCDLRPTGMGLIASLGSESSCVHCFERQDMLQMKNTFTFHCTKNPAVHLSSIQTHLLLLFPSFSPSWHSSRSTFGWKALSLISFQPLFLIKKTRVFLSSLKAFWLAVFQIVAQDRELIFLRFPFLYIYPISLLLIQLRLNYNCKTRKHSCHHTHWLWPRQVTGEEKNRENCYKELHDKNDYLKNSDRLCQKVTEWHQKELVLN